MEAPGPEDFTAAGLWDPSAQDAADRLELLQYLASEGVTIERMLRKDPAWLVSLGFDHVLESGDLTAEELAERLGVEVAEVAERYRRVGVEVTDPAERIFEEKELDLLTLLAGAREVLPEEVLGEILRAVSSSLDTIASAAITAYVGTVEDDVASMGPVHQARMTTVVAELGLQLASALPSLFRHHLRSGVELQRSVMQAEVDRQTSVMAVGFVDIVGYTSATADMDTTDLIGYIGAFRARTHDLVTDMGGRVVKHIGDEIMFSAVAAADACEIGCALISGFDDVGVVPRGGVAHGRVIARHGDLYGPVVNLASRLADVAVPGELLAPAGIAEVFGGADALVLEPAGRRLLKGFAEPVATVTVALSG